MSTRRDLGMGVMAEVAVAPDPPVVVRPGQTVKATMTFMNGGVLPITVTMRLDIQHENGITPLESSEVSSAEVPVGGAGSVACTYVIPSNWGSGNIWARVKAKVAGDSLQDIEKSISTHTPVWHIPQADIA